MSSDEVTQINIGRYRTGIIGLKPILAEVAETCAAQSDEEICSELLKRLGQRNYIPERRKRNTARLF